MDLELCSDDDDEWINVKAESKVMAVRPLEVLMVPADRSQSLS